MAKVHLLDHEAVRCSWNDRQLGVGEPTVKLHCVLQPHLIVVANHHQGSGRDPSDDRSVGIAVLREGRQGYLYIKPDKDFIAFGFGEVVNPAREEGARMHPIAWTLTSLDNATETRIRALLKKAVFERRRALPDDAVQAFSRLPILRWGIAELGEDGRVALLREHAQASFHRRLSDGLALVSPNE